MYSPLSIADAVSSNAIPLWDLLSGCNQAFRVAVLDTLESEGFELEVGLMNFQHPNDIFRAVDPCMQGAESDWLTFQASLLEAVRTGMLVDIGALDPRVGIC